MPTLEFADLPHRFHQFSVPTHGPYFDNPELRWTSFVGHFLAPIACDKDVTAVVFLNHAPRDFELRFASANHVEVEKRIEALKAQFGINSCAGPTEGEPISRAFVGARWLSDNKRLDPAVEAGRSAMIFQFLDAGCKLYIHNLVPSGNYWTREVSSDRENPLGNSFESMMHLIANFSDAQFDVKLSLGTAWMQPVVGSIRCKL